MLSPPQAIYFFKLPSDDIYYHGSKKKKKKTINFMIVQRLRKAKYHNALTIECRLNHLNICPSTGRWSVGAIFRSIGEVLIGLEILEHRCEDSRRIVLYLHSHLLSLTKRYIWHIRVFYWYIGLALLTHIREQMPVLVRTGELIYSCYTPIFMKRINIQHESERSAKEAYATQLRSR